MSVYVVQVSAETISSSYMIVNFFPYIPYDYIEVLMQSGENEDLCLPLVFLAIYFTLCLCLCMIGSIIDL